MIEVLATGPAASVQDGGRPGWAALGVPHSGAFDAAALRLANRLVGNDPGAAGIEIVLGGLAVRTDRAVTLALTGAPCPGAAWGVAVTLPAGGWLRLGTPATGLRSYLALRGGVAVDPVLGSASTDTLSGLGPPVLRAGDRIATGRELGPVSGAESAPGRLAPATLAVRPGPRDDWFTPAGRRALVTTTWRVRAESDRVGVRLDGPPLERARDDELPSEAVLPGAVQVPGDGRPLVFGPDAPVTGGYPVIGVIADLGAVAQLRPGDPVRLRWCRDSAGRRDGRRAT
ncbi:biotin-dependent carboxylase uncharacterized domain-containing protein [Jatrophihabitans endophyticus]|uniref:Biotin-dependent carboxylase uncharacterized domain-containing protein n=1 Tax=Jatrophihabitans endophyticus TaxID=1206085 RepID=A0A1M5MEJ5_9ACTN|nr:biotin-dependent carboxyltransferase family protein [Jatrophihabitans endophyticus]SHG75143.1 biotin-dependent carboxylase uncharacterized domain-containing protein [Jatrophihabitans endophyticus]